MKKRILSVLLTFLLVASLLAPAIGTDKSEAAAKYKLNKKAITLATGKSKKLKVKNKAGAKVSFKSAKKKIASVSKSGRVKGRKQGSTRIIVRVKKNGKNKKLICRVKVVKKVKKINVYQNGKTITSLSLLKGSTTRISAKKVPASSKDTLSYSSSDSTIVSVSKKGVIKGKMAGSAKIYVKAKYTGKRRTIKVTITRPALSGSLKEVFANDFTVGCALNVRQFSDKDTVALVKSQFNSMTMENEMKPEALLNATAQKASIAKGDEKTLVIDETALEKVLATAAKNGMKLRGHTLVWHSQTPNWIFYKGFDESKTMVSSTVMNARMESYIKQVMQYCQTKYPGVVYAWDVVNEAMADGGGDALGYRTFGSMWYTVYQSGAFVEKAFEYAAKYRADGVKLFYNDYNAYETDKMNHIYTLAKTLYDKGILDGVGMQSHYVMASPTMSQVETAIRKYASIGEKFEIQLTELDIHNTSNTGAGNAALSARYKALFEMLLRLDRGKIANITNVTFWGLTDDDTWLTNFRGEKSYPLLFNSDLTAKSCFDAIIAAGRQ